MRATTTLHVPDNMELQINLQLNVGEARTLLKLLEESTRWPIGSLRSVLQQSLTKATQAYHSEHAIEP